MVEFLVWYLLGLIATYLCFFMFSAMEHLVGDADFCPNPIQIFGIVMFALAGPIMVCALIAFVIAYFVILSIEKDWPGKSKFGNWLVTPICKRKK